MRQRLRLGVKGPRPRPAPPQPRLHGAGRRPLFESRVQELQEKLQMSSKDTPHKEKSGDIAAYIEHASSGVGATIAPMDIGNQAEDTPTWDPLEFHCWGVERSTDLAGLEQESRIHPEGYEWKQYADPEVAQVKASWAKDKYTAGGGNGSAMGRSVVERKEARRGRRGMKRERQGKGQETALWSGTVAELVAEERVVVGGSA